MIPPIRIAASGIAAHGPKTRCISTQEAQSSKGLPARTFARVTERSGPYALRVEALRAFAAALLALRLLFSGDAQAERACRAASEMQWLIERTGGKMMSSVGDVELRMSRVGH